MRLWRRKTQIQNHVYRYLKYKYHTVCKPSKVAKPSLDFKLSNPDSPFRNIFQFWNMTWYSSHISAKHLFRCDFKDFNNNNKHVQQYASANWIMYLQFNPTLKLWTIQLTKFKVVLWCQKLFQIQFLTSDLTSWHSAGRANKHWFNHYISLHFLLTGQSMVSSHTCCVVWNLACLRSWAEMVFYSATTIWSFVRLNVKIWQNSNLF